MSELDRAPVLNKLPPSHLEKQLFLNPTPRDWEKLEKDGSLNTSEKPLFLHLRIAQRDSLWEAKQTYMVQIISLFSAF